jgi:Rod binding domain-containing protein
LKLILFICYLGKCVKPYQEKTFCFPKATQKKIFEDMLDEEKAKAATNAGGIGLAETLFRQMRRDNPYPIAPVEEA